MGIYNLVSKSTNITDPTNPPDNSEDREKKISKYLYIGIGSAAGLIILIIIIFILFRIAGKCKKLERNSTDEGIELAEKRTAYLLQEGDQEEEIIPKEEEKIQNDEENHPKEEEKNE